MQAMLLTTDPAGLPHQAQVPRDSRKIPAHQLLDFRDTARPLREYLDDLQARRMGQRLDHSNPVLGICKQHIFGEIAK